MILKEVVQLVTIAINLDRMNYRFKIVVLFMIICCITET